MSRAMELDSYHLRLERARARLFPPTKWAINAFFRRVSAASRGRGQPRRGYRRPKPTARSDVGRLRSRRAAGFLLHTFLSPPKEKCERPIGLQALLPRRSRRVRPRQGDLFTTKLSFSDAMQGAFRSPPAPLRATEKNVSAPWDGQSLSAPESARQAPPKGNCLRQRCYL